MIGDELDLRQLRVTSANQVTTGATIFAPGTEPAGGKNARVYIAFASVKRNAAQPNHVTLKFGSRVILSTTGPDTGGPFMSNPDETVSVEFGATTTGDYTISWMPVFGAAKNVQS